jgi:hypothetical protein
LRRRQQKQQTKAKHEHDDQNDEASPRNQKPQALLRLGLFNF